MPRKTLVRDSFFPYHVYNRSLERNFYPINSEVIWNKCSDLLFQLTQNYDAKIHAFVLMSNHYHLLISTPKENLDQCIWHFQSCFANWMCTLTSRKIYSFESRYKWSIIKDPYHYQTVFKYILRNPLRAGLCEKVENYRFSSVGDASLLPVIEAHDFMLRSANILKWLNLDDSASLEGIRKGLRRKIYTPPKRLP